ncbi:hypothetical protein YC2023_116308 [Brassica napus]
MIMNGHYILVLRLRPKLRSISILLKEKGGVTIKINEPMLSSILSKRRQETASSLARVFLVQVRWKVVIANVSNVVGLGS